MSLKIATKQGGIVGQRFAVFVISLLFAATAAGWLLTELFPRDFSRNIEIYRKSWGGAAVAASRWLRLDDPFHSVWYTALLVLFFLTLLLCIATGWKSFVRKALFVEPPAGMDDLPSGGDGAEILWIDPLGSSESGKDPVTHFAGKHKTAVAADEKARGLIYEAVLGILRKKGYSVARGDDGGTILFTAAAGRWRYLGNLLFHAGLLALTAGGMLGSIAGKSEFLYGRRGDLLPLQGSENSIRVDDFRIIKVSGGQVGDYVSTLSVVDKGGAAVRTAAIEVNKPLKFGGFNIYQSAYYVDEEMEWAALRYEPSEGAPVRFTLRRGSGAEIEGTGYRAAAGRFFPDFRMGRGGPFSASPQMANPALEVSLFSAADTMSGYLFLMHPKFNTAFGVAGSLFLEDLEPVYYTGLEISSNPGASLMLWGMGISSAGLLLLYAFVYKKLKGHISGDRMAIRSVQGRRAARLSGEIASIEKEIRAAAAAVLGGRS